MTDNTSVRVAVRIRPLAEYEINKGCRDVIDVVPENDQLLIRPTDKSFTFNYVLDAHSTQEETYTRCVQGLISNLFNGFNVTILAYGQTGSGKTHTMGTAYKGVGDMGIIPRVVKDIFEYVKDHFTLDFTITVSFIELYQEVLYDLLAEKSRDQCVLEIREDASKGNYIPGMTEIAINDPQDILDTLAKGSLGRATGSTNMNSQSSRSHAIFTINICIQNKDDCKQNKTAKLHLVDLAGSERPKKTGAVGNTFREGININKGLFVLGNVISCLGDEKNQNTFVPYRDSNLTRLLKDSLGGNSITLMIACISPTDYNLDETMSTLRYADRAKRIKNKPIVNQDPKTAEINALKKTVQQLRLQLLDQGGPMICPAENELLKKKYNDAEQKIRQLNLQLSATLIEKTGILEKNLILQSANEKLSKQLFDLGQEMETTFANISLGMEKTDPEKYNKLQELQNKIIEMNTDQKDTETAIKNFDESFTKQLWTSSEDSPSEAPAEVNEKQNAHNFKQLALNTELQEISKQLQMKEGLAKQLITNAQFMVDYTAMTENEEKITNLQKEKDELLQQLKTAQSQEASGKLAEQRRKRVKELEAQILSLHKKVQEQGRLIKLKEKDEIRIKRLNVEITQMKQAKVKLIRSMREESDKFKAWTLQRVREVAKLKQEDRKKANEIVKIKLINEKQQNVLRRKVEQANALNKRLQLSLQLRKQAQDKNSGKSEKTGFWVKQELDVFLNLVEAEETLSILLEDRATLQHQLDTLRSDPDNEDYCKSIQEDIECRSAQILDLQQKVLESDEDNKIKAKFENIQSMAEAKHAVKLTIDEIAQLKRKTVKIQFKLAELQDTQENKKDDYDTCLKTLEKKYKEQIAEIQNVYEEKVAVLLNLQASNDTEGRDLIIQEERERQETEIKNKQKKIEELEEKLEQIVSAAKNDTNNSKRNVTLSKHYLYAGDDDNDDNEDKENEDDFSKDPDWRNTPLGKRIIVEKRKLSHFKQSLEFNQSRATKRSSEGGCTCKTSCNSARCGCKKVNRTCSSSCKCKEAVCVNRETETDQEIPDSTFIIEATPTGDVLNDTFKKPRFDLSDENTTVKKGIKKGRNLFQTQD